MSHKFICILEVTRSLLIIWIENIIWANVTSWEWTLFENDFLVIQFEQLYSTVADPGVGVWWEGGEWGEGGGGEGRGVRGAGDILTIWAERGPPGITKNLDAFTGCLEHFECIYRPTAKKHTSASETFTRQFFTANEHHSYGPEESQSLGGVQTPHPQDPPVDTLQLCTSTLWAVRFEPHVATGTLPRYCLWMQMWLSTSKYYEFVVPLSSSSSSFIYDTGTSNCIHFWQGDAQPLA